LLRTPSGYRKSQSPKGIAFPWVAVDLGLYVTQTSLDLPAYSFLL
jgi:hypothetical protein